ncbi:MAG: hypothetical protein AcusKO_28650 [Acuticoccus sp.]
MGMQMSASTKRRGVRGYAANGPAIVVSVLLHVLVVAAILWESNTRPVEAVTVDSINVELVDFSPSFAEGEEALQASEASASEAEESESTQEAAEAEGTEETAEAETTETETAEAEAAEGQESAAEASEAEASEAEASESEAAEADTAEADATEAQAEATEAETTEADATETDATEAAAADDAASETAEDAAAATETDAIAQQIASLPPPSPIATAVGTPDSLYGGDGRGPNVLADPSTEESTAESASETEAPPVPDTPAPAAEGASNDATGAPQQNAQPDSEATPEDPTEETAPAASTTENPPASVLPEDPDNETADDARLAILAREDPFATLTSPTEAEGAPPAASEAAPPSPDAQSETDALTDAETADGPPPPPGETPQEPVATPQPVDPLALADTPVRYRENPLPVPNPIADRETTPDARPVQYATPAAPAGGLSEALRLALSSGLFGATGAPGLGSEATSQVAYTEAVRSAIAPLFFNAMRNVNASGTVVVEVVIRRDGTVSGAKVVQGSGNDVFDRAALFSARGARYPPLPPDITRDSLTVHIPLRAR